MANNNGAWKDYDNVVPKRIWFRSEGRATKTITIKSGQVLKALSFIETNTAGKGIAHGPITEGATAKFAAITAGQTVILGGLTWTAGGSGTTAAQLTTAWKDIAVGTGYAALSARTGGGSFTAGTLTGFSTETFEDEEATVMFNSSAPLTNPTDLAATGTGAASVTIVVVSGSTTFNKIAGVTVYDVDASSADVDAAVYTEGSFWADALVWAVDPAVDTITKEDGSTVACTTYNTGAYGTSAASNLLKQKFVEGSEFEPLGFLKAGEVY